MTETFGRQWEQSFGTVEDSAFRTWTEGLADLSLLDIKSGLVAMLKSGKDFPPNLIQFRAVCIPSENLARVQTYGSRNFTEERIAAAKSTERLTHDNPDDSKIAQKCKRHMDAIFAGAETYEFEGQTYPVEMVEQSYVKLGLHARWNTPKAALF